MDIIWKKGELCTLLIKRRNYFQCIFIDISRNWFRTCQIKSLQKINFQFQYFLDLLRCFKSLCNDLHITFMCICDNIFHNLLFIRIRINITDDRKIYFDILRCQIKKALLVTVSTSVVIQCKSTSNPGAFFFVSNA